MAKQKTQGMSSANPLQNTVYNPVAPTTPPSTPVQKPSQDQTIYNSPLGQNDTLIYNTGTGQYKVQTRMPGTDQIIEKDMNGKILYQGTNNSDTRATVARAQINDAQQAAAYDKANPVPNVTPDQLSQVGQIPDLTNNPNQTTQDINANIQNRQALNNMGQTYGPLGNVISGLSDASGLATGALNSVFPGSGTALLNTVSQNRDVRQFLNGYSQQENFKSVSQDVTNAQNNIALSIKLANQPGNSDLAIKTYNDAIARLNLADAQLKKTEQNDQRAYVDDIKLKRRDIQEYLTNMIPLKNQQLQNALIKPNPGYYDTTVENIMSGGQ